MYLIDLTSTDNGVKALKDSREAVAESTLDPPPLAFSRFFIFSEQVRRKSLRQKILPTTRRDVVHANSDTS